MRHSTNGSGTFTAPETHHPLLSFSGKFISVVFHPLFIPLLVTAYLLYVHPMLFTGLDSKEKIRVLASVFVNLTLLPAMTVFLLWRLKFADNIFLRTQKERIIPFAAVMFFAFWCWNVFRNLNAPTLFVDFLLGTFIAVIIGWIANIYYKISLHALGVGGMAWFITRVAMHSDSDSGLFIAIAVLIAGLVCTSRLIVSDHKPGDIYTGLIFGAGSQWLAGVL